MLSTKYEVLREKIDNNSITVKDIKDYPLVYAPTSRTMFATMLSLNDNCWTLEEYYILKYKRNPPDFLRCPSSFYHNHVFVNEGLIFKREVKRQLTSTLLLKYVMNGTV